MFRLYMEGGAFGSVCTDVFEFSRIIVLCVDHRKLVPSSKRLELQFASAFSQEFAVRV